MPKKKCVTLIAEWSDFVVACLAASGAVKKSVLPKAHIELPLTQDAILFAVATQFVLFTLPADNPALGRHRQNCILPEVRGKRSVGNCKSRLAALDLGLSKSAVCLRSGRLGIGAPNAQAVEPGSLFF